jgi:hypothetical protein
MLRSILLTAGLLALPSLALAADLDAMLDRLEIASEAAATNLTDFYRERLPEDADKIPDFTWGEPMRAANLCILKNIEAARGDAAVTDYVEANEEWAKVEITTLDKIQEKMPPILLSELAAQLGQSCGASAITMQRIEASGFDAVMRRTDVGEKLM